MRCPACSRNDDKVVDSRAAEDGAAIRRRRECLDCGRRFTTYERIEEAPVIVVKRNGSRQPFDRAKVAAGLRSATKNLTTVQAEQLESIVLDVEEQFRLDGPEVSSEAIGLAVLDRLRLVDGVGYLRFASVYKGFTDPGDFTREAGLLAKSTAPKPAPVLDDVI